MVAASQRGAGGAATRVAVAGVHTTTGAALLARLVSDPQIEGVVAIDRDRPPALPAGVQFVRADLRDALLARVFADVDVVVNAVLAETLTRDDDRALAMRVQGTRRLLDAARTAGAGTFVHVSSALVYGAGERNRVPLDEQQPLRADPAFSAVHHALEAEEAVRAFAGDHPQRRVVVLRTVPVLVPDVDSPVTRHLESPLLPRVRGFDPPVQFVAVDDLVEAVRLVVVDTRARGVYNVAADGWLTSSDVRHILARPGLRLPEQIALGVAALLHRLRLLGVPPAALRYLMHPWVVDTARLRALGWTPATSQRAVLHQFVTEHRRWLSLGRLRFRTTTLLAVVTGAWAVGMGIAAWLVRHRWMAAHPQPDAAASDRW
ncbi:MAG TPA: NAD-dependent epimerase/dehydratase family protein [Euzebyales bacterium]|nr:NAD-dependent epimerase/dehydratase family protein [Euzebyales bacterium]